MRCLRGALTGAALSAAAFAGTAHATGLPDATSGFSWAGFHIGGNAGYGIGQDATRITEQFRGLEVASYKQVPDGFIGGGQLGYRWQSGHFVFGGEADFQWSGQDDRSCFACPVGQLDISQELEWFGTVRGVVGIAYQDWLWYVTGGYAYGSVKDGARSAFLDVLLAEGGNRRTQAGWTLGGGVEARLWGSKWSTKLEYLYMDLGSFPTARSVPPSTCRFVRPGKTYFGSTSHFGTTSYASA